jgi:hypothetical protein
MTDPQFGDDLLRQLLPVGIHRLIKGGDEGPFASDLDFFRQLEARVLLQVI